MYVSALTKKLGQRRRILKFYNRCAVFATAKVQQIEKILYLLHLFLCCLQMLYSVIYCYKGYVMNIINEDSYYKGKAMKIIITNGSSIPIYEQIMEAVKENIRNGTLSEDEKLPSVRELSKELKISILTVKKAYDELENAGFIVVRQGLGSFVAPHGSELDREELQKELERHLGEACRIAKRLEIAMPEFMELTEFIFGDKGYE